MNLNKFIEELQKINIKPTERQLEQLERYYDLLIEYNKVMNLTGITEREEVYLKHFYDSLTLSLAIDLNSIKTMCDVGSGAGFPGIVIKILYPHLHITLIDSLNKRINFLKIVIKELELNNIEAIHSRIEDYSSKNIEQYDLVTSRAVAPLNILLEISISQVKINGYFVAMKGNIEDPSNFDNAINKLNCSLVEIKKFKLPIENSNRSLVKIIKNDSTSKLFPRKFSNIKKKPL